MATKKMSKSAKTGRYVPARVVTSKKAATVRSASGRFQAKKKA